MCFSLKIPQFYPKLLNMDLKQIHDLIKVVNKSNIGEISIEDKDGKVTIKQKEEKITVTSAPAQVYSAAPAPVASTQAAGPVASTPSAPVVNDNLITIKSPMIGTFYRRAAPDKPLMAEEGTEVSPGKVVCIIEAMKLFNEIESEVKGTIVKVLVEDASPVEYDQPLFLVQPA
ncbi:MAG: acetyl-CoA carboxylase biotin carboxyl carrier protein [Bacteroidota bacterium]